jgi:hypothetical protein
MFVFLKRNDHFCVIRVILFTYQKTKNFSFIKLSVICKTFAFRVNKFAELFNSPSIQFEFQPTTGHKELSNGLKPKVLEILEVFVKPSLKTIY